jgi:hypothetical protein
MLIAFVIYFFYRDIVVFIIIDSTLLFMKNLYEDGFSIFSVDKFIKHHIDSLKPSKKEFRLDLDGMTRVLKAEDVEELKTN